MMSRSPSHSPRGGGLPMSPMRNNFNLSPRSLALDNPNSRSLSKYNQVTAGEWDEFDPEGSRRTSRVDIESKANQSTRNNNDSPIELPREKFQLVYPYTPLPENFLDHQPPAASLEMGSDGEVSDNSDCNNHHATTVTPSSASGEEGTTIGCAKTGLWDLKYVEEATRLEFTRFCHRSLDGATILVTYGVGSLLTYVGSTSIVGFMVMFLGLLELIVVATEITVHYRKQAGPLFTAKDAHFRHTLHVVGGLAFCLSTTWHLRGEDISCLLDTNYVAVHGHEPTGTIEYQSCFQTVNPHTTFGVIFGLCTLRIDIYLHFALAAFHWLLQLLSLTLIPAADRNYSIVWEMTPAEMATRLLLAALAMAVSCLVAYAKHKSLQRGFEAAMDVHYQMRANKRKVEAVDALMTAMVPPSALGRLLGGEKVFDHAEVATVLFSDMVQFTLWSSARPPAEVVGMLSILVRELDILAAEMEVSKIKTIGDCYWAVTGIPDHMDNHAEVMISFGLAMLELVRKRAKERRDWDYPVETGSPSKGHHGTRRLLKVRTGIHSGPVQGGVLGSKQISYEVFGETSAKANQVEAAGTPDRVTVSGRTKRLAQYHAELPFQFVALIANADIKSPVGTGLSSVLSDSLRGSSRSTNGVSDHSYIEGDEDEDVTSNMFIVLPHDEMGEMSVSGQSNRSGRSARSISLMSSRGMSSGHKRKITVEEEERAQAQRQKYVETHLLKGEARNQLSQATKEELTGEFSEQLHCCVLQTFADQVCEEEFTRFATVELINLRVGGAVVLSGAFIIVFWSVLMGAGSVEFGALDITLHMLCLGCFSLAALLALKRRRDIEGQEYLDVQPSTLEDLGGPLASHMGMFCWCLAGLLGQPSIVTNDSFWSVAFLVVLVTVPNNHRSTASLWVGAFILATMCLVNAYVRSHRVTNNLLVFFLGLGFVWMVTTLHEKRLRVQFVEKIVASHFAKQQAISAQAQTALLGSMLPDFVIEPLAAWLASDFDPAHTVVQNYDQVCVAFIRMTPDATLNDDTAGAVSAVRSLNLAHEEDDGSTDWLFAGHKAVDRLLQAGSRAVDKVKTVGDLVIIAGSFRGHSSAQSAAGMLSVVTQIHSCFLTKENDESGAHSVTVGLHAGPVVAVVLGYSRLSFDIFGDTVNTCSRVMTHPSCKSKIAASAAFLDLLPEAPYTLKHALHSTTSGGGGVDCAKDDTKAGPEETVRYGPLEEIQAKGKGVLSIREVLHTDS